MMQRRHKRSDCSERATAAQIIKMEVLDAAYEFGERPASRGDSSPLGRLRGACIRYFEFYQGARPRKRKL